MHARRKPAQRSHGAAWFSKRCNPQRPRPNSQPSALRSCGRLTDAGHGSDTLREHSLKVRRYASLRGRRECYFWCTRQPALEGSSNEGLAPIHCGAGRVSSAT
nr:MAG TPA: hypothetical protein [Caudoviricetes sp.]